MNPKHEEAKISIAFPHATPNYNEVVMALMTNEEASVMYSIYGNDENGTMEIYEGVKENQDGLDTYAVMFSDRELGEKAIEYYSQVTDYFSAIGEELKVDEESGYNEYDIREEEVNGKWFNGNFNYWLFEKGE